MALPEEACMHIGASFSSNAHNECIIELVREWMDHNKD